MNFRQRFEQWHLSKYRYICGDGSGTALDYRYRLEIVQARWEAWQASAEFCSDLITMTANKFDE